MAYDLDWIKDKSQNLEELNKSYSHVPRKSEYEYSDYSYLLSYESEYNQTFDEITELLVQIKYNIMNKNNIDDAFQEIPEFEEIFNKEMRTIDKFISSFQINLKCSKLILDDYWFGSSVHSNHVDTYINIIQDLEKQLKEKNKLLLEIKQKQKLAKDFDDQVLEADIRAAKKDGNHSELLRLENIRSKRILDSVKLVDVEKRKNSNEKEDLYQLNQYDEERKKQLGEMLESEEEYQYDDFYK